MNCFMCNSPKKYKCSSCKIPYCSILCYKQHKTKCLGPKQQNQQINSLIIQEEGIVKTDFLSDQGLRIPKDKLEKLAKDPILFELLKNQDLRNRLISIDNSKQRMTNAQQSMQNEEFYNFFKKTMEILQMDNQQQ